LEVFGVLADSGVAVGSWEFEGRALNKPVNRAVHRGVKRFSKPIEYESERVKWGELNLCQESGGKVTPTGSKSGM
jgi:hypothetical protein